MNIYQFFLDIDTTMEPWAEHEVRINERRYWHIKSGGKILLVAHVDTVLKPVKPRIKKKRIKGRGLDDRLGIYMAMTILEEHPEIVDVLITDDEEIGMSTASLVPTEDLANYNCIIELDRGGDDFVHYGLAGPDLVYAYEEYADKGFGMASDIMHLNKPNCGCINVGIGYYKAHAKNSYCKTEEFIQSYHNVMDFIEKYQDVHFEACVPPKRYSYAKNKYFTEYYESYEDWETMDKEDGMPKIERCDDCDIELLFEDEIESGLCNLCECKKSIRKQLK